MRPKLVVNEPTLRSPTVRQMSATERSVFRSSAAARSSRRVSRYRCGVSPKVRRNSRLKWAGESRAARASGARRAARGSGRRRDPWRGARWRAGRDRRDHRSSIPAAGCGLSAAPTATAEGGPLLRATAQQLALFEAGAGAEHDAFERRVRHDDGKTGFELSSRSSPRNSAPPPASVMPWFAMSAASSGGVDSSVRFTVSTIVRPAARLRHARRSNRSCSVEAVR